MQYSMKNTQVPENSILTNDVESLVAGRLVNHPMLIKMGSIGRTNFRDESGNRATSYIVTTPTAPGAVFNFSVAPTLAAFRKAAIAQEYDVIPQKPADLDGETGDWKGMATENFVLQKEADGTPMLVDVDGVPTQVWGKQITFTPVKVTIATDMAFQDAAELSSRLSNASSTGILTGSVPLFRQGGSGRASELKYETLDI